MADEHFHDGNAAREYVEARLWPDGPCCPHCGATANIWRLQSRPDSKHRLRPGVCKCGGCRKQFTVTVGTIFEDSHVSLDKWLYATHLMCSSKNGISVRQLQRALWGEDGTRKDGSGRPKIKGSYRTAWFMCRRIHWALSQPPKTPRA